MRSWTSLRNWLAVALTGCALVADVAGCGGDDTTVFTGGDDGGGDAITDAPSPGDADAAATRDADAAAKSDADAMADGGAATGDADAMATGDAEGGATGDADAMAMGDGDATMMGMGDADAMATGDGDATMMGMGDADAAATTPDADAAEGVDADAAATMDADAAATTDADAAPFVCGADGGDNESCSLSGSAGLCKSNVCSQCTDVTDDTNCTAAYGGVTNHYLCLAGACTPGDCRNNGDCASSPNGGFCGIATPNFCGKCTSDQQCSSNATKPICNTGTGQCDQGLCSFDGGVQSEPPGACPVNAADICCAGMCQPASGSNACCSNDVVNTTYCSTHLAMAASCVNNTCTSCTAGPGTVITVDPNAGSDSAGNGNGTPATCAFKTITRALQVIGNNSAFAVTVKVIGPSTVGAGETFPLLVPKNVTITTSAGAVTVNVPANKVGFTLSAPSSGISGGTGAALTISGQANTASNGVVATTGSAASTSIGALLITGFLNDGIFVHDAGILTVGAGVTSEMNGTTGVRRNGLHVTGTGNAIISVPSGTPTHFDNNTLHGILVDGGGFITLTGAVTSATAGTGTVTASNNFDAGLWVSQTPGGTPPQNVVDGLVAYASTNGNGIHLHGGSNVELRNSVSLANALAGVIVSPNLGNNEISMIDLGSTTDAGADYGNNVFQEPRGMNPNGQAGICLAVKANTGTLSAQGNTFGANNCAMAAAALSINRGSCGNGAAGCTGGICDLGIIFAQNDIDVSKCTHP